MHVNDPSPAEGRTVAVMSRVSGYMHSTYVGGKFEYRLKHDIMTFRPTDEKHWRVSGHGTCFWAIEELTPYNGAYTVCLAQRVASWEARDLFKSLFSKRCIISQVSFRNYTTWFCQKNPESGYIRRASRNTMVAGVLNGKTETQNRKCTPTS